MCTWSSYEKLIIKIIPTSRNPRTQLTGPVVGLVLAWS